MEIIAHRGASYSAPENTLAAFRHAWREDADGIELDVHLTADHKVVVIHDPTTDRTSTGSMRIQNTHFDQLAALDVGSWKSPQFKDERIPLLQTVLDQHPISKTLYIEIKSDITILTPLNQLLIQHPDLTNSIVLFSFSFDLICKLKQQLPHYICLWIVEFGYNVPTFNTETAQQVMFQIKSGNLDGISTKAEIFSCSALAPTIKENGWLWNVWTVDKPEIAEQVRNLGVDSLTTNTPAKIRHYLSPS